MSLLHPDKALRLLLAGVEPLAPETVPLARAHGRTTAVPLAARLNQPPFDASAMDGWAVRFVDLPGPLTIIGEAAAGHGFAGTLGATQTVRIFTGAPLPAGADTVVVQEEMAAADGLARLTGEGPPHAGAHVRRTGQDFAIGAPLLSAGTRLGARHIGLIAAAGHGDVQVCPRPRLTLVATGDELVPPGTLPGPGQIVSANGVMLASLLAAAGAEVSDIGILPDSRPDIAIALCAARDADLIITIGGASVGDHDLIMPVLADLGASLDFWKIAMRPGKPLIAGTLGSTRLLGLPGNPVSAYVCALLFAVPLVRTLAGLPAALPHTNAILAAPLPANGNRRDHLRARRLADGRVMPAMRQDSGQLAILAGADLLIIRQAHAPACETGESVECIMLDTFSDVA